MVENYKFSIILSSNSSYHKNYFRICLAFALMASLYLFCWCLCHIIDRHLNFIRQFAGVRGQHIKKMECILNPIIIIMFGQVTYFTGLRQWWHLERQLILYALSMWLHTFLNIIIQLLGFLRTSPYTDLPGIVNSCHHHTRT